MENVVIIGTGCAGLTAAIYTARANLNPLVFTGTMPGGLLTTTSIVENYPGFPEGVDGYELMTRMQKQAERFGAQVKYGTVEAVDTTKQPFVLTVDGEPVEARTIIIASGAGHRHLGLESEKLLDKKGVTYCATCDGALPMFRNKPLVVVGGGDSACEEASYLTRFASEVYLIHRRDSLRASKIMSDRTLANPKIKPVWDSVVTEVLDVKQDKVTGVRVKNLKTNAESVIDCAGLFVAIGHVPNTQLFKGVIDMDENGYIKPVRGTETNVPGIFVAGDCSDHVYRQAITAAGLGCAAAIDAERYLAGIVQPNMGNINGITQLLADIKAEIEKSGKIPTRVLIPKTTALDLVGMTKEEWMRASKGFMTEGECQKLANDLSKGVQAVNGLKITANNIKLEVSETNSQLEFH